ncbi:lanthionine synthetase C family protein [Nonomuraea sp. NPDC050790]|uniref:lanthionine synthetase C family protein n=1 Tax=Nonomuraea sp. NPDC050790 TaxID=3364371 RepID=UPI00378AD6FF
MSRAEAAQATAVRLAERLADPREVAAVARRSQGDGFVTWTGFSLAGGHAGVALALAGFGDAYLPAARAHLSAAAGEYRLHGAYGSGLYEGLAGLGYAAAAIARQPGDCARVLATCTADAVSMARERAAVLERQGDERTFLHYDVIEGLSGLARFLLARDGADGPETVAAVTGLSRFLCPPVPRADGLPPWLVGGNPALLDSGHDPGESRLLDLGVAHGVAGAMSMLAVAKLEGVRVPRLDEAIGTAATWLAGWRGRAATDGWPTAVWPSEEAAGRSAMLDRMAWCYGTPGVAAALCMAGRALGRDELGALGRQALVRACDSLAAKAVTDMGICHGWAGIAAILMSLRDGGPSPEIEACLDGVIDRIVAHQDDELPFLYRYPHAPASPDMDDATFLTGAAGTAAILYAYSQGGMSSTPWRDVLMLG